MRRAPASCAISGNSATGQTMPLVPTTNIVWQAWQAARALCHRAASRCSPNQTTAGRIRPAQDGQTGGASRVKASASKAQGVRHSRHWKRASSPCKCQTSGEPARSCRSSTFWVNRWKRGPARAIRAKARCPALGWACLARRRRAQYHCQTRRGRRRNPAADPNSSGSKRAHRPVWASRKVGMPDSALMPAPVRQVTTWASWSRARARSTSAARGLATADRSGFTLRNA